MDSSLAANTLAGRWIKLFLVIVSILFGLTLLIAAPIASLWIYKSGDLAVDRAVAAQKEGFALYGSGLPTAQKDALFYKLSLYKEKKPQIVVVGSSGMGSLRESVFARPMLNMTGLCSSLSGLRQNIDAMLALHKPDVMILALDFWWFSDAWEKDPFVRTPLNLTKPGYSAEVLRMPLQSLLNGSISLSQFLFLDFTPNRFGMRAQFHQEGCGPDGSYYAGDKLEQLSPDAGFLRTKDSMKRQIGPFAVQEELSAAHLDALADIYFRLRGRGVTPLVCLAPVPVKVMEPLKESASSYPHLFTLASALEARGIAVTDTTNVAVLDGSDCEFVDGLHAGEVLSLRVLSQLATAWNGLYAYLNMEQLTKYLTEWKGHAQVGYEQTKEVWETDFLGLGCVKKTR